MVWTREAVSFVWTRNTDQGQVVVVVALEARFSFGGSLVKGATAAATDESSAGDEATFPIAGRYVCERLEIVYMWSCQPQVLAHAP